MIALSTAVAARNGILVKDRLALERMRTIDAVLFDKTGTLTKGEHVVTGVAAADGLDEDEVLRLGGGVESDSEHPLARAIVAAASERGEVAIATGFRALTGRGVEATIDGVRYAVGGPALLRERGLDGSAASCSARSRSGDSGVRPCSTSCAATRSSARWRSRTRSGPRPARPSPTCSGWA